MAESPSKEKRYPRDSEKTKNRILESAQELFSNSSYDHVRSRDIAQKAGVDVALVNRYFGSKKGLFLAVLNTLEANRPDLESDDLQSRLCDDFIKRLKGEGYQKTAAGVRLIELSSSCAEVAPLIRERMADEIALLTEKLGGGDKTNATALVAYAIGMHTLFRLLSDEERKALDADALLEPVRAVLRQKS